MQTFLPYVNFHSTARTLDYRRLGKQRVEALQIHNIVSGKRTTGGWINHPAGVMKSWPASFPLRAIDIKNQYSDSYKLEEVDWSLTDNARMRIVTPLEDPALTYPSMASCEKLASIMLDEAGKHRWRMPSDLQDELSKRGVKV